MLKLIFYILKYYMIYMLKYNMYNFSLKTKKKTKNKNKTKTKTKNV